MLKVLFKQWWMKSHTGPKEGGGTKTLQKHQIRNLNSLVHNQTSLDLCSVVSVVLFFFLLFLFFFFLSSSSSPFNLYIIPSLHVVEESIQMICMFM